MRYHRICSACGFDSAGAELNAPCPSCGQNRQFEIGMTMDMSISMRGPGASLVFPPYSTKPHQTTIRTKGDVTVGFGAETHEYKFASFSKQKLKLGDHWAQVNLRRDMRGLDILFGQRAERTAHSHYSYTSRAETLYARSHGATEIARTLFFDSRDGAFVPIVDHIDDPASGLRLELQFRIKDNEIVLVSCRLVRLPQGT